MYFIQCKESVDANSELFEETDEVDWIKIHMKFDSANESVLPLSKQNPGEEPGFSALIPDYSNRFILWVRALLP